MVDPPLLGHGFEMDVDRWLSGRRIVALVPAHNEEAMIAQALCSINAQWRPVTRIFVIADNCTDSTVAIARANGAEVFRTFNNTKKKAGALNQALRVLLPRLDRNDLVLVIDADTAISPGFVEESVGYLDATPYAGAAGGIFQGSPGGGLLGAFQRNEFARYGREVARRRGNAKVLTGTASVFRVSVLREIMAARGVTLPGRSGDVYDTLALTEDNEITLAIKTLGHMAISPRECLVRTENMPTWEDLWRQRLRWHRGALDNLRTYGITAITVPYIANQLRIYLGICFIGLYLISTVQMAAVGALGVPHGFWLACTAVFIAERVLTVRRNGWRGMLLAVPLVIEFGYELFQQAVFIRAAFDFALRRDARWHHVVAAN